MNKPRISLSVVEDAPYMLIDYNGCCIQVRAQVVSEIGILRALFDAYTLAGHTTTKGETIKDLYIHIYCSSNSHKINHFLLAR